MYNPKFHNVFHNLENQSLNNCAEVETFIGSISEWADELVDIVKKEFTKGKDSTLFLLPKTPKEKKTRNKKGRNALVSKCPVKNSTYLLSETDSLDEPIQSKTISAGRLAAAKMSQFCITRNLTPSEETKHDTLVIEVNGRGEITDATFVMPKASTRTKPVLKTKQPEAPVSQFKTPGKEKNGNNASNVSSEKSENESPPKKISRTGKNSSERVSRRTLSRTPTASPAEEMEKTPIVIMETQKQTSGRRKISRTLSRSPGERQSSRKIFRSLSGSPVVRSSSVQVRRSPSKSSVVRSSSLKNVGRSPATPFSRNNSRSNSKNKLWSSQSQKCNTPEIRSSLGDRTVTIKKESSATAATTFIVADETLINDEERTPVVKEDGYFRLSKTSTPTTYMEKIPPTVVQYPENSEAIEETNVNESVSVHVEEASQDGEVPKKKRKVKNKEEVKENIEMADTVRITRTKSKAIKQMMEANETKQVDLSAFAKKLLIRAKMTSVKKNQLAALLENNSTTPTNAPGKGNNLPFGNLTTSKSKYHLLLSSSKKLKTPLATLPNSAMKIAKPSTDKDRSKRKVASRDSSVENTVRSVTKAVKTDLEKEMKLKSKKEKEEEAALKRQNVIKSKQEELRRKNELKHQMAMKQREKLEQEKYQNMIQSEKEKEQRHKLILQERQIKLKEEAFKRKMLTEQKIAETVERRRLEEEARIAKLKEMEAEEQRLALEKQKEQERQEKRAQERLAQKKAREEYEMQLKQELEAERLKAEKLLTAKKCAPSASKFQSTTKRQKFGVPEEKREWDYKPRNENDYGLDEEHSEVDSEDENSYNKSKPAVPWGKKILHGKSPVVKILTLEMLCEFVPCYQKTPDIHKMFKMTPTKRIKRTSSAIWNTPSS